MTFKPQGTEILAGGSILNIVYIFGNILIIISQNIAGLWQQHTADP